MRTKSIFIAIIILSIFLFGSTFGLYFAQDDFLFLADTQIGSINAFLNFFIPRTDVVWYRPLSTQVFFFLGQQLFGLNPFPYHIVVFATHALNIFLVYTLTSILTNNTKAPLIAALLYGLNAHHFVALAWLSNYSFVLGPTCILLTIINYCQKKYAVALITFFFGLLTTEMVIFTLGPILVWEFFQGRRFIKHLWPYALLTAVLFLSRRVFFPAATEGVHTLHISTTILSMAKFYVIRINGFNLFETRIDTSLTIFLFSTWGVLLMSFWKMKIKPYKTIILCLSIVFSFLLLFLLLPQHFSVHYLTFSIIGFSILAAVILSHAHKFLLVSYLGLYSILQMLVAQETNTTHWIVRRAHLAKDLIQNNNLVHPVGSEEYFALGAGEAIKLFNDE